jgi:hypothetical protein
MKRDMITNEPRSPGFIHGGRSFIHGGRSFIHGGRSSAHVHAVLASDGQMMSQQRGGALHVSIQTGTLSLCVDEPVDPTDRLATIEKGGYKRQDTCNQRVTLAVRPSATTPGCYLLSRCPPPWPSGSAEPRHPRNPRTVARRLLT